MAIKNGKKAHLDQIGLFEGIRAQVLHLGADGDGLLLGGGVGSLGSLALGDRLGKSSLELGQT